MKSPDAILMSDPHLREDRPLCRTDNYWDAMWEDIDFIDKLQIEYNCPILNAGDLFNKAKPSLYLVSLVIDYLPDNFISIAGQHDVPNHNPQLLNKSGIGLLQDVEKLKLLISKVWKLPIDYSIDIHGFSFGEDVKDRSKESKRRYKIALIHTLVTETESAAKLMGGISAKALLNKMKGYNLIVCGDNHKSFTYEQDGRLLVNPGSMMRMSADQIDHKPCVYLWYAEDNHIEPVYLPIKQGVISREHIEKKEDRDKKIDAFVNHLKDDYEVGLSFEKNLEEYFRKHRTKKPVEELVWEAIG
jgi:DNA repair exonuclease SbcCD nuclease subunit